MLDPSKGKIATVENEVSCGDIEFGPDTKLEGEKYLGGVNENTDCPTKGKKDNHKIMQNACRVCLSNIQSRIIVNFMVYISFEPLINRYQLSQFGHPVLRKRSAILPAKELLYYHNWNKRHPMLWQ